MARFAVTAIAERRSRLTGGGSHGHDAGVSVRLRLRSYLIGAVLLVAVAFPLLNSPEDDDFPLSTYPMFSGARASGAASIPHAIGVELDGSRVVLPPEAVANEEVIQAFETLRQAIAGEPDAVARLCEDVAAHVRRSGNPGFADIIAVEIVTDRYDVIDYFEDDTPLATTVHTACEVERPG